MSSTSTGPLGPVVFSQAPFPVGCQFPWRPSVNLAAGYGLWTVWCPSQV